MKCIKNKHTGTISRVDDEQAHHAVQTDGYDYCSKHEWREQKRKESEKE